MRMQVAIASLLVACSAAMSAACEAQRPSSGLPGRSVSATFENQDGSGRHEAWAARDDQLEIFAAFASETQEYDHGILGKARDAKGLTIHVQKPGDPRITCPAEVLLPKGEVFEDIAPRLADLDGDGLPEVIVVHTDVNKGARLAVYDRRARLIAATPHIGRTHRWLAPIGAADLDGDGRIELAYIDRPHLAKRLRIWQFRDNRLVHRADLDGLTNHRIGWDFIPGGIRNCSGWPEIITANADWSRIMAVRFDGKTATANPIADYTAPASLDAALDCR